MPGKTQINPRTTEITIDSTDATASECIDMALFFRLAAHRESNEEVRICHTIAATLWEQAAARKKLH